MCVIVVKGDEKGEIIWSLDRINPSESFALVLFHKGAVESVTASATVDNACTEFAVACRDRSDDSVVFVRLTE